MKPNDTNGCRLGLLGLLLDIGLLIEKPVDRPSPRPSTEKPATRATPATFGLNALIQQIKGGRWSQRPFAATFVQRSCRIVTRASITEGRWSDTTHPEISNLLNRLQKRFETFIENRQKSVISRLAPSPPSRDFPGRPGKSPSQAPSKATKSPTDIRLWHLPGFYLGQGTHHG